MQSIKDQNNGKRQQSLLNFFNSNQEGSNQKFDIQKNRFNQNFEQVQEESQLFEIEIISENDEEEFLPKAQQEKVRQVIYVLPHYINQYWKIAQVILSKMADGKYQTYKELFEVIRILIKSHYEGSRNIEIANLENFIENNLEQKQQDMFLHELFPFIARQALQVKHLFQGQGLQMMLTGKGDDSVGLTKEQIGCLLSNMFLCTTHQQQANIAYLSDKFNFSQIFREGAGGGFKNQYNSQIEKIKCMIYYFLQLKLGGIQQNLYVTYKRLKYNRRKDENRKIDTEFFWKNCDQQLSNVVIQRKGAKIQEDKKAIQIEFANQYIGGGVLGYGLAQEEVRFLVSPELIPSVLIFEKLQDDEAFLAIGTERCSIYSGYRDDFQCEKSYNDLLDENNISHLQSYVVGIDALNFSDKIAPTQSQFFSDQILRELVKAYVGFQGSEEEMEEVSDLLDVIEGPPPVKLKVATGQWGCGVYKGDQQLQFIIQWLAASIAERDMNYYVYEEQDQKITFENIVQKLIYLKLTVGDVYRELIEYAKVIKNDQIKIPLFQYIRDFVRY